MDELKFQSAQQIMSAITTILRYVASGFVALMVFLFLYNVPINTLAKGSWFYFLSTASLGLLTYSFHIAFLDKLFYREIAYGVFKKSNKETKEKIEEAAKDCGGGSIESSAIQEARRGLIFALATQTYLRNISENKQVRALQDEMEKRLALLCFLYCSFYQITAIILYFLFSKGLKPIMAAINSPLSTQSRINLILLIVVNLFLIWFACEFNKRICIRDAWAVTKFYQKLPVQVVSQTNAQGVNAIGLTNMNTLLNDVKQKIADIEAASDAIKKDMS